MPETIAKLEAELAAADEPRARVDALNALAWALRFNDPPRAHGLASEARELAREQGYPLGQARAARTMAMTPNDPGALQIVFELAREARELFDEAGDQAGRAASRDFLASLHEFIGDHSGGMELALEALSIAREIDDPVRQGYALSNVGGILAASGETDQAVERLEQALQLFEDARDPGGVGTIASRLTRVLKDAGRNEQARCYAQKCRQIAEDSGDSILRLTAMSVMAELEDERGNPAEAERLYRSAMEGLTTELGRSVMWAETQIALGRLLLRQGKLKQARVELEDVLARIAGEPMMIVLEASAREVAARLCEREGRLDSAINQLRQAQTLRERIARQDARNKLAQVEARAAVEAARKDAEIHKLRYVELHAMQAKLVEAERMALLGRLAAGAAHELNTPLAVLRSDAELTASATARLSDLLRGEAGEQAARLAGVLRSCRETTDRALERIAAIGRSLGRFAELDQAERRAFDLRESLESALALLEPTLPPGITLERRLAEVPQVQGWPRELNHAFMTVLQNAVQAIDESGVVTVETAAGDGQVEVRIRDTGRGMTEEQVARLFDVAWSERGPRTRLRLGLSAAWATMQKHGGTVEVQSTPGQGTLVSFHFPL